jgi:hypothetical protein
MGRQWRYGILAGAKIKVKQAPLEDIVLMPLQPTPTPPGKLERPSFSKNCSFLCEHSEFARSEHIEGGGIDNYCDRNQWKGFVLEIIVACSSLGLAHTPAILFRGLLVVGITLHIPD